MAAGVDSWTAMRNMQRQSPYKNCQKRFAGCHGRCAGYARFRDAREQVMKKRRLRRDVQDAIDDAMKRLPGKREI